jgi:hypothetical protein
MEDVKKPIAEGAGGGKKASQNVTVQQTVVAPTRSPVEEANNLFSTAFAKTVYAISEGEIEGFPNGIEKDTYLDSTPIQNADGTVNFTGYELDYRSGTDETQTPLLGFSTVENAVSVNTAVTVANGPVTRTITDLDVERCRVIIAHTALQSTNQSNGDITGTSVSYRIAVSANGGPYVTVAEPTVSGKSNSEFQRAYEFDLTGTGPWGIRVTRLTQDSTSAYLQNATLWQSYTEIIDEKLSYPNTAHIGIKVDARQFNSIPDVSLRLRGKRVQVPQNYDPLTRTYTGLWNGTFKTAWTNNPAWIFRDIVLNQRFGVARYVSTIAVDPWFLYTISQYCDELVPSGDGGLEPRFTCNVYLQNPGAVYEVLNSLASVFRGLIYYADNRLYLTQDRPQVAVQQFSEANVIQEVDENGNITTPCFNYRSSARTARKTVCIANWDDPQQSYSSVVEYLQDDELLQRLGYNPVDLRLIGVTSRGQALRAAKHTLFSNRYETENITFSIGAEGLASSVGEIIQVSDPLRQGQRLAGRIISISGNNITLDAKLSLNPAISYTLSLVIPGGKTTTNPDNSTTVEPKLQVVNVVSYNNSSDRTVVTCDSILTTRVGALWVLEWASLSASLYRIISISEPEPLVFQVEAIQYNDSKYDYVDNDLPIAVPKDRFTLDAPGVVTNLTAGLFYRNKRIQIEAQWKAPQRNLSDDPLIRGYRYQWRKSDAAQWSDAQVVIPTNATISLPDHVYAALYQLRVASFDRLGRQGEWVTVNVSDFEQIPNLADPLYNATIRHQNQPDGTQLLIVDAGTCPIPERITGYKIWAYPTNVPTVVPGVKPPDPDGWYFLVDIPLTGYYTIAFHAPGEWEVRAAFTSAIFGETPTDYLYDTVERNEIVPPTPDNFTVVENQSSRSKRFSWQLPLSLYGSWDQGVVSDVVSYEIRFKQGGLINGDPSATWDAGIELYSGGVTAKQQWFETSLFDSDEWTVMVKSVDATQWRCDLPAYVLVNIGAPLVSNAVYTECIDTATWPGTLVNAQISDEYILVTQSGDSLITQDSNFITGPTGVNCITQIDPSIDSCYIWNFDNNFLQSALLITTTADATYQHSIGALTGADTNIMTEVTLGTSYDILLENNDFLFAEQRTYSTAVLSGQSSGILHPYAPFEQLIEDVYQVKTLFRSNDNITPASINNICFDLDYPDVVESRNDIAVSSSISGTAIPLLKTFRAIKSVQLTLQDVGTGAINSIVLAKTTSSVTVKCVNSAGAAVAGLIDMTVVGY